MGTQRKRIIGVTGGVGAGKSTVLTLREKFGADVFLADTCAHELMDPGPSRGAGGPGPWAAASWLPTALWTKRLWPNGSSMIKKP